MTIAWRTQCGNCLLKQWSLETTPTKSTYQIQQTSQCHCEGTDGDSCSSWKSCPFHGCKQFHSKVRKTSNRKEVEPCLQYISSLKLPQREALRNIGPINAPIWSNLSVLNSVIKWPFYVELSVAAWSTGHLKLPQQKALTKYNRQVSAIVRVPMVTVVAVENLVHLWVQTISFKSEKKTSNRKEVEPCLQYIFSLKLPQREALRNIGPINAPIWSNLSVLNSVIKWPFYVELSVAIISWSTGHLKLPQQKALTKYNRQVSAIVRVPMVTVVAVENLVHFEDWNSKA